MKMYYDKDAERSVLQNQTIAIIGFGSQGMRRARISAIRDIR